MSAVTLAGVRGLFVDARPRVGAGPVPPPGPPPIVAVLCAPARAHAIAASIALALARIAGRPCAVAAAVEAAGGALPAVPATPGTARAARRLRERGQLAIASGRLVRLAALPGNGSTALAVGNAGARDDRDTAGIAAAAAAALARAATVVSAPAALAIPFARVAALDRVLAWHDGIVVAREPGVPEALIARALDSLAALGRPVVTMAPATGAAAAAAGLGVRAPATALDAVARLGLFQGAAGAGR